MKKLNKQNSLGQHQQRQQANECIYTYLRESNHQTMAQQAHQQRPTSARIKTRRPRTTTMITSTRRTTSVLRLVNLTILIVNIFLIQQIGAQFLFTYEINQDDSRAPKSSLFDPSSFKIVTPSQLQSSYQKLSGQPPEQAPNVGPPPPPPPPSTPSSTQTPASASASFLKQTSAALQSFAELFSLAPSSSPAPSPLASAGLDHHQQQHQAAGSSPAASHLVDQQAEAKSLHEHWTQQQQKAHLINHQQQQQQQQQQPTQHSAFQSFTTLPSTAEPQHQHQHEHQLQQQQPAQSTSASHSNQPVSPASYWLTANPLSAPDGGYLVEIKTPQQQQQQPQQQARPIPTTTTTTEQTTAGLVVDSLLSLERPSSPSRTAPLQQQQQQQSQQLTSPGRPPFRGFGASANIQPTSAQSSFLSTPTSYYPNPSGSLPVLASPALSTPPTANTAANGGPNSENFLRTPANTASTRFQSPPPSSNSNHHLQQSQPLHSHQARSLVHNQQQHSPRAQFSHDNQVAASPDVELRPPANSPENFPASRPQAILKSAEESLNAFRQQQERQHDQQNSLIAVQQQLAQRQRQQQHNNHNHNHNHNHNNNQHQHHHHHPESIPTGNELNTDHHHHHNHNQQSQGRQLQVALGANEQEAAARQPQPLYQPPANQPLVQSQPARQQQQPTSTSSLGEIPKVSPQIYESFLLQQRDQHEKHMELLKQQQELNKLLEQKQKKEQEAATAAAAADQQKRKQQHQRKKDDLERQELRKKEAAAASAAAEQQERTRKARQEAEEARRKQLRRKQEEEERRRKAADEERKYRELFEAREREEKRQREVAAAEEAERQREADEAAERKRKQQAADEAAKYRSYLRQQEELKKLLELKQREDEGAQARQRQAGAAEAAIDQTSPMPTSTASPRTGRPSNQATRANKLAQEHRQRTSSWGTPVRGSRLASSTNENTNHLPVESSTLVSGDQQSTTAAGPATPTTTTVAPRSSSAPIRHSEVQRTRLPTAAKKRADEKLIRQKIPLYSGAGKYGLYRSGNESLDLAALLDSVTLPISSSTSTTTTAATTSTSTTTTTTSTTTPPPELIERDELTSTSLSPLLLASNSRQRHQAATAASEAAFDDDDVPRRPSRTPARLPTRSGASVAASTASPARHVDAPPATNQTTASRSAHIGLASLPADADNDGIPGRAGVEYPVLSAVPPTSFSCAKQPLNGYYADTETACQVVHLCQGGVQSSILCPNGTIFNQEKFSCQWWYEVNCSRAPMFYQLNDNLPGASSDKPSSGDINKLTAVSATSNSKRTRTNPL